MSEQAALLDHILEAADVAARIVAQGHARFLADPVLRYAADTVISRIGECSKRLSDEALARMPSVPWREVRGMRNRLQHASMDTDYVLVWNVLEVEMPKVRAAVVAYRGSG